MLNTILVAVLCSWYFDYITDIMLKVELRQHLFILSIVNITKYM